jgi:putative selenate reductase
MSDRFTCLSLEQLLLWIKREEPTGKIFGIPRGLFFRPTGDDPFRMTRYGRLLESPIGVAAGPHTQLSQNIVSAWLTGARYIELKTVQVLDELDVTKPCISMDDEGYNCEWSQELRLHESLEEYLNALVVIHLLKKRLQLGDGHEPGFIFNMSVGYNLEGILSPGVQKFLDSMRDAGPAIAEKLAKAKQIFPEAAGLVIDPCVSDNITISTMHGCPPDEIEKIGHYFIGERKLHTTIKLNPTLLGPQELRRILNDRLGFDITVPDIAFEHDLKYEAGVALIKNLLVQAKESGVAFNIKLTNTLETRNDRGRLPESEQMVYMSGRPLHVISVNLAAKLQKEFAGQLDISFSAGCDCFNLTELLACGLRPVTVCSDLLKPGGYGRLAQYLQDGARILPGGETMVLPPETALGNLLDYAGRVKDDARYHRKSYPWQSIKTARELGPFDCIAAPCRGTCPAGQDVPSYMYYTSKGMFDEAFEAIVRTNPFPNVQGLVCDHPCTDKCTRINYDEPLKIREIKRFVAQHSSGVSSLLPEEGNGLSAAVIGGGPSGFSAAYFLRLNGFEVDLFEAKSFAGGMAADAIPSFRLDDASIQKDIDRIVKLGVTVHYETPVGPEQFDEIRAGHDYVYIGVGAAEPVLLDVPGADSPGVYDQLTFLRSLRRGQPVETGRAVTVVGGGNSAMDAARAAKRLVGAQGRVTILYRRKIEQMPADREEIEAVQAEGIEIREMVSPVRVMTDGGRVSGIECLEMELGTPDESGRPRPVARAGSEFTLGVDTVISAIGQKVVIPFAGEGLQVDRRTYTTNIDKVYAGGDAIRGASTLIKAIGDGQKAARSILADAALTGKAPRGDEVSASLEPAELEERLARRRYPSPFWGKVPEAASGFDLVSFPMTGEEAMREASRCLGCDTLCNICTTVCPNRANIGYETRPFKAATYAVSDSSGGPVVRRTGTFTVNQTHQVANIGDFCNECGNCTTFCPSAGSPYRDKPKLYLRRETLEREESGFAIEKGVIYRKTGGREMLLRDRGDSYSFETDKLKAKVDRESFAVVEVLFHEPVDGEVDLSDIAEMAFLYRALKNVLAG